MTNKERNRLVLVQLVVILVIVNCSFGDVVNSGVPHEINIGAADDSFKSIILKILKNFEFSGSFLVDTDSQPLSLIVVEDSAYEKRNNVNRFKSKLLYSF